MASRDEREAPACDPPPRAHPVRNHRAVGECPADLALGGDEKALDAGLARLREAGVTDFVASIIPSHSGAEARTLAFLQSKL